MSIMYVSNHNLTVVCKCKRHGINVSVNEVMANWLMRLACGNRNYKLGCDIFG